MQHHPSTFGFLAFLQKVPLVWLQKQDCQELSASSAEDTVKWGPARTKFRNAPLPKAATFSGSLQVSDARLFALQKLRKGVQSAANQHRTKVQI